MKTEIETAMERIAYQKSNPFCYHCYRVCPTGTCPTCRSDDLMRHVDGVGVEYGIEWVVKHLIETELEPIDTEEAFEESLRELYPDTVKVGWIDVDPVDYIKNHCPTDWRCAYNDWLVSLDDEASWVSFDNGSTYYYTLAVERYIAENDPGETEPVEQAGV